METFISIFAGLAFRFFLSNLEETLGGVTLTILGLWEGVVLHHLLYSTTTSASDNYLAYAFRVLIDLLFTGRPRRSFILLAWTGVGLVLAEGLRPAPPSDIKRRRRPSRSVPAHVRVYSPPTSITPGSPVTSPPVEADSSPRSATTLSFNTTRTSLTVSSPDIQSEHISSPTTPKLPHFPPTPIPDDQPPASSAHVLPTPPPSVEPEALLEDDAPQRLPPVLQAIEEATPSDSLSKPHARSIATAAPSVSRQLTSHAAHVNPSDNEDEEDMYYPPMKTTSILVTVPVSIERIPSASSSSVGSRTPSQLGRPIDDPLMTPEQIKPPAAGHWPPVDDDPLTTPPEPPKVLSPLFSDPGDFPDFGTMNSLTASAMRLASSPPVLPIPFSSLGLTSLSPSHNIQPSNPNTSSHHSVEYPSSQPSPVPAMPQPDADKLPAEAEFSARVEHKHVETDSETETDATSVISGANAVRLYAAAEALRNQARECEADKARLKRELAVAENEARVRDVLFLREEIRVTDGEARKLHERAVKRFYKARNLKRKPEMVDVHGLRVTEAIRMTEKALREASKNGVPLVKVIVGKGLHSQDGVPILKQAIMKAMEGLNISCKVEPKNDGVLILTVP